ncbi:HEAT repeat domain-containing protein [Yinghuangia aomiensis]
MALPEQLRPRLAVTLIDALSDAEPEVFPDLVRTAAGSDAPAVVMWVRAFASTPGPRRHAALEALVDVGDPDVGIELEHLMRSPDPGDRLVAARLTQRRTRRAPRLRSGDTIPPQPPREGASEPAPETAPETLLEAAPRPASALPGLPALTTPLDAPPTPPDDPWRPTYHGILRVVGSRWFELMQRHPPIHATSLPPGAARGRCWWTGCWTARSRPVPRNRWNCGSGPRRCRPRPRCGWPDRSTAPICPTGPACSAATGSPAAARARIWPCRRSRWPSWPASGRRRPP